MPVASYLNVTPYALFSRPVAYYQVQMNEEKQRRKEQSQDSQYTQNGKRHGIFNFL
jgi:hypothetical protein